MGYYEDKNESRHKTLGVSVKMILIIVIFALGYSIIKQFKTAATKAQIEHNSIK